VTTSPPSRPSIALWVSRLGPLIALVVLMAATVLYEQFTRSPGERVFLTPGNLLNILRQAAPWGVVAIGMTFVIISGGIDLSVGALAALAGGLGIMTMAAALERGTAPGWVLASGVAVILASALALGAINGLLVWWGRLAPFIATLSTLAAYRSIALALVDGGNFYVSLPLLRQFGSGGIRLGAGDGGGVQLHYPVLVFFAVAILAALLLRFTTFGLLVRAVGDNDRAAAYAAVRTGRVKFLAYSLLGLCCGVSAVLLACRMGGSLSSSSSGLFYELDAIAAVVIGGTRMQGGAGRISGTVLGVLILAMIGNILTLVGVGPYYQGLVRGIVIIAAVLVQRAGRAA
jgi:ribose transport system permease protein